MGSTSVFDLSCTDCCEGYTPGSDCICCPDNVVASQYLVTLTGIANDFCTDCESQMNRSWILSQIPMAGDECEFDTTWSGISCGGEFGNPFWERIVLDQCLVANGSFHTYFSDVLADTAEFRLAAPAASCVDPQTVPLVTTPASTYCNWAGTSVQVEPI